MRRWIIKYGPTSGVVIKNGLTYSVKNVNHKISGFVIRNKIYLMKQNVLDDFYDLIKYSDYILRKHNIDYTVAYGTLLGAVRHGGIMPWDDDADLFILTDPEKYIDTIFQLKIEIENDGYILRQNYDAEYFHLVKKSSSSNFPYVDWYRYHETYEDKKNLFPLKRFIFEDFEVNIPQNPIKCIDMHYNRSGKNNPILEIVHTVPFSRYYSLWLVQKLKKTPRLHHFLEFISRIFYKPQ